LRVLRLAGALAVALSAGAVFAAPGDRAADWREDLDTARAVYRTRDRSFAPRDLARFEAAIARLESRVGSLRDDQIIVELAQAVALSGNAHTRVYLLRNRTYLRRYPIRLAPFPDGLYVIRAGPELRDLLGARLEAIDARATGSVRRKVAPLYAGNRPWRDYMSTYLLTSPEILRGVGVERDSARARFTFRLRSGRREDRMLAPRPLVRVNEPTEAWWDLSPLHPGRFGPWEHALGTDSTSLPLYLRHPTAYYWFERLPEARAVYFQYNRSANFPGGENLAAFTDRLLADLRANPPKKLIVDVRFNTGGDLSLADSLFHGLAALPLARERGRLFVITGRSTFSAGISHVAELRQWTAATIVGEPVGDGLDMWSEGGNVVLPHSGITVHYTNGLHSYSRRPIPAGVTPKLDLSVDSVAPDLPAHLSAAAYFAGRDPALEAILGR